MTAYVNMTHINGTEYLYIPTQKECDEAIQYTAEFNRNHSNWAAIMTILAGISGVTFLFSAVVLISCDSADDSHGFCGDGWGIVAGVSAAAFCGLCAAAQV